MRELYRERLLLRTFGQLLFASQCRAQHTINEGARRLSRKLDCLIDGSVLCGTEEKELVKAEPKNVAHFQCDLFASDTVDPEIEQREIAQNPIKHFLSKGAITGTKSASGQRPLNDGIGKVAARAPPPQHMHG